MVPGPALTGRVPKAHFSFTGMDTGAPVELESLGYNPEQEPVDRPKGYQGYHWLQTTDGAGCVSIGPRRLLLDPGQGLLVPPGLPHSYQSVAWPWSTRYLTFRGPMAEMLVGTFGQATSTPFTWNNASPLGLFLSSFVEPFRSGQWGTAASRSTLVYSFLAALREDGKALDPLPQSMSDINDRLAPLFEFVEEHLGRPELGVEDLARFLAVSPRHLNELFAKAGRSSPYQYLKTRRIARARQLLLWHRDLGVKEVSSLVGFRDPSHFIHAFRQAVGKSPDQYRRSPVQGG
jgi:AraC-like DNA-binding protein